MCFSVQVDKDIKKLARRFQSGVAVDEFNDLQSMIKLQKELDPVYFKKQLGLKQKPRSKVFKLPKDDGLIYPNYFAPVIKITKGKKCIHPMRYRLRPNNSQEEIPNKYNVYNARIDALEKRESWRNLFLRNHGLFPFIKFYEYVSKDTRKALISFKPENCEVMWAPCLWDYWISTDGKLKFYSFALITKEAPPEIETMGHDRCPIFLREESIDQWLSVKNAEDAYEILNYINDSRYLYEWEFSH